MLTYPSIHTHPPGAVARGADFALTFPPDPVWIRSCRELVRTSVRTVRDAATEALTELAERAVLLTSEAATNAVTASAVAGCTLPITLYGEWPAAGRLRVHVRDGAPGLPYVDSPADEAEHGRGMQLIATLASRYGFCLDGPGPGKSFWFQLEHGQRSTW